MGRKPENRRVVTFLIALCLAGLVVEVLVRGNDCLVPKEFLQPGEAGTAEVSIYGVVLYREVGMDLRAMYHRAVWWYETALLVEWGMGVVVGGVVYALPRWRWGRGLSACAGGPMRERRQP